MSVDLVVVYSPVGGGHKAAAMAVAEDARARGLSVEIVDAFAVPYGNATSELASHGVDRARIFRTGIPVRSAFERIAPVRMSRRLRVLVTSGGFGVGPMTRIVRSLAAEDLDLTVVCGA